MLVPTLVWIAVWTSNRDYFGAGTDSDIIYSISDTNGVNWSLPKLINSFAGVDIGNDNLPRIEGDENGIWNVVWYSNADINGAGTDNDVWVSGSSDNGQCWTAAELLNDFGNIDGVGIDDFTPDVKTDNNGNWVAVWYSEHDLGGIGTDEDIMFAGNILLAEIDVMPTSIDFGGQSIDGGATGSLTLRIENNGNTSLLIHSLGIVGIDSSNFGFSAPPDTSPIAPGNFRNVNLIFDPISFGAKSADVQIVANDITDTTTTVQLLGEGRLGPVITLLDLVHVLFGATSSIRVVANVTDAEDVDGSILVEAFNVPPELSIQLSNTNGQVSAKILTLPSDPPRFIYTVDLQATDSDGILGFSEFTIIVSQDPDSPVFTKVDNWEIYP